MDYREAKYMLELADKMDKEDATPRQVRLTLEENGIRCMPGFAAEEDVGGFSFMGGGKGIYFKWYDYPPEAAQIEPMYAVFASPTSSDPKEIVIIRTRSIYGQALSGICTPVTPGSLLTFSWYQYIQHRRDDPFETVPPNEKEYIYCENGQVCTVCTFGPRYGVGCSYHDKK